MIPIRESNMNFNQNVPQIKTRKEKKQPLPTVSFQPQWRGSVQNPPGTNKIGCMSFTGRPAGAETLRFNFSIIACAFVVLLSTGATGEAERVGTILAEAGAAGTLALVLRKAGRGMGARPDGVAGLLSCTSRAEIWSKEGRGGEGLPLALVVRFVSRRGSVRAVDNL
jgi:hypothetical protein